MASIVLKKSIFSIEAEVKQVGEYDPKKGYSLSDVLGTAREYASRIIAEQAKSVMKGWLMPKGKSKSSLDIGWTGRSAQGLQVSTKGLDGTAVVFERNNMLGVIRKGLPSHNNGPHQSIEGFKRWIEYRGIEPASDSNGTSQEDALTELAYRIRSSVKGYGTSKWMTHHVKQAEGHRYFNYPQYYNRHRARQDSQNIMHKLARDKEFAGFVKGAMMKTLSSALGKSRWNETYVSIGQGGYKKIYWAGGEAMLDDVKDKEGV